jgi:hypothetical protein
MDNLTPRQLYPWGKGSRTYRIGNGAGLRVYLDSSGENTTLDPVGVEPGPAHSLVTTLTELL